MPATRTHSRVTRGGRVVTLTREHYLRDDLPCGAPGCHSCPPPDPTLPASTPSLRSQPYKSRYLLLDGGVAARQLDFLEHGGEATRDVVLLQSVLDALRRPLPRVAARLSGLLAGGQGWAHFSNEHHRETYTPRLPEEPPAAHAARAVRAAASWLAPHFHEVGCSLVLLTDTPLPGDDELGVPGLVVSTCAALADAEGPELRDLVSAPEAAPLPSSATSSNRLFPPHWSTARLEAGLLSRTAFRGVLRVSRECFFEARVAIHGVAGRGAGNRSATTGGDDVVSVLVLGTSCMNRAFDGDSVVIELLPRSRWRAPSQRMVAPHDPNRTPDEVEAEVLKGLGGAPDAGMAEAGGDGTAPATAADLRALLKAKAEMMGGGLVAQATAGAGLPSNPDAEDEQNDPAAFAELAAAAAAAASATVVPTGRVVGILRRNWRQYAGTIESGAVDSEGIAPGSGTAASESVYFVPMDGKVPRIRIETRQRAALLGARIVVAPDAWDACSPSPTGHYVRTLGQAGVRSVETEALLLEYAIPCRAFSPEVLACLPPKDWTLSSDELAARTDLRGLDIASVDPPGCKDIDDALHARWLPGPGPPTVEVGVHIADVTHFVKHGSAIDVEAAARANTTYMVDRRMDMLPGLLTETLCSLRANVDRLAFSTTWQFRPVAQADAPLGAGGMPSLTPTGVPTCGWVYVPNSVKYFKSVIRSAAALTYGAAQDALDRPTSEPPAASPPAGVVSSLRLLLSVARSLRGDRVAAGALSLASPEVKFQLDDTTHDPLDVSAYELRETNSMVEEFMLLANVWVARKTATAFPRCALLRRHPSPPPQAFEALHAAAAAVGVVMDVS